MHSGSESQLDQKLGHYISSKYFFSKLYVYLLQKLGSEGHSDMFNGFSIGSKARALY